MSAKLPGWAKVLYGAGSAGWSMIDRVVITWLMYFYTTGGEGGAPLLLPAVFGLVMLLGRVADAIADPLVALWSDNFTGRRGRRTPFMLYGGVLYALVFAALFFPPAQPGSTWNLLFLIVALGLYFILFTVYVCPYLALLPEIARTSRDRLDLSTWKALFSLVGVAAALVGSGVLIASLGFQGMVVVVALAGAVFMYLPLLVPEKKYARSLPAGLNLKTALATTLGHRAFRTYLAGNLAFWFGFNIVTLSLPYYVTVLLEETEAATTIYFAAVFGVAAIFFPLVNYLGKVWGLKRAMLVFSALFVAILPVFFWLGQPVFGLGPRIFALIIMALTGIPLAGLFVLPDAVLANISDLDESVSGQRREAMFFGTQGFFLKLVMGLSSLLSGFLFQVFGQTQANSLGVRLTGPVAALLILVGVIIFARYPESEVNEAVRQVSSL